MFYSKALEETGLLAYTRDDYTGVSVVCEVDIADEFLANERADGDTHDIEVSPFAWRAFQIRMGSGAGIPGVVGLISSALATYVGPCCCCCYCAGDGCCVPSVVESHMLTLCLSLSLSLSWWSHSHPAKAFRS